MADILLLFQDASANGTIGSLIVGAFFVLLGIVMKGVIDNKGTKDVAKIESETTLSAKAMETMTAALEFLREENKTIKTNMAQLESHMDTLIDYTIEILHKLRTGTEEDVELACQKLEQLLKSIGRWPY